MSRPRVYVTRQLPPAAMAIIAGACDYEIWPHELPPVPRAELLQRVRDKDGVLALLTDRIDDAVLAAAGPRLRVVANMAVGYDNIDVAACTRRGVLVTNTPGVLTETTADLVWALLMATARRLVEGQKLIEAGQWQDWSPMLLTGQDVYGATLGIVGAGRIGIAVARRARGFDMRILYHNRRPSPALEAETGAAYREFTDLLREADFVVCLLPLTVATRRRFGRHEFKQMKPTAVFINAARGPIVDEAALYDALRAGTIWAAGLDVFDREPIGPDHPLLTLPNCVCLPHMGSASVATRTRMATLAAENLVAALSGRRTPAPVNPEVLGQGPAGPVPG